MDPVVRSSLLPSVQEAQRLINIFPHGKISILPNSGHACLLEKDINLYQIIQDSDL